jgi:23S rRNA (uracil1939-C5)-methyltransferase
MKVVIEKLGINGEGVARIDSGDGNKVCFVDYALPNEDVDVQIVQEKSRFVLAKINKINKKSDDRISPRCPYFTICGGCDLQHLKISCENDYKSQMVKETIQKIAKIDVNPEVAVCSKEFQYRNKMVFPVGNCDGEPIIGMFKNNSHEIVEISQCCIASDEINSALQTARKWLNNGNYLGYDFKRLHIKIQIRK